MSCNYTLNDYFYIGKMESKQIVDAFQTMMFNDFKYKWLDCITSDSSRLDHSGGNKLRFCRTFKDANIGEHYFKYKILTRNEKRTLDKCIKIKRQKTERYPSIALDQRI